MSGKIKNYHFTLALPQIIMKQNLILLFAALFFAPFAIYAQVAVEMPATDPAETPVVEEEDEDDFSISGFVDAYYQANLSTSANGDLPLVFPTSFTGQANEFGVGMVNLLVEKSVGKVGFVGQVGFGPRASDANGDVPALQQLFVTYSPSDAVTFTLGNFGTFVGYEVIDAPVNVNYSTSYLFSNGPFFHTGIKADIALGENFGLMVGAFNDTDTKIDVVPGLHYGAQLSAASGSFAAYLNFLAGKSDDGVPEVDEDNANDFQVDLVATYEVSETFMLGLNVSDKTTSIDGNTDSGFSGAALYSTIGLSDAFSLGLRGEYFAGKLAEGVTGDAASVTSFTVSGNFTIGDLRFIPEVRMDSGSNGATFGPDVINELYFPSVDDDTAMSFILAAVYSF